MPAPSACLNAAGAELVCGLDDILTAPVNGSGCNEKYGLLGSNKATEDHRQALPPGVPGCRSQDSEAALQMQTGAHVEAMVYGDGAFKDPIGGHLGAG